MHVTAPPALVGEQGFMRGGVAAGPAACGSCAAGERGSQGGRAGPQGADRAGHASQAGGPKGSRVCRELLSAALKASHACAEGCC